MAQRTTSLKIVQHPDTSRADNPTEEAWSEQENHTQQKMSWLQRVKVRTDHVLRKRRCGDLLA